MNKAFVKETDDPGDRCPLCGSKGQGVFEATLKAFLSAEACDELSESAYFCPHATCEVAYFDRFERTVAAGCLSRPAYPKDPEAPICPCFGLTCEDIEADVDEGVVTRVRAHLERAQSDEAHCTTKAPSGQSCVAAVQQCFMRLRGQS